jgi:heme/copper-type cytochrome/quinol oxidase subunit 3
VLARLWRICDRPAVSPGHVRSVEIGAGYRHLVDLLWVVLFALLYLMA